MPHKAWIDQSVFTSPWSGLRHGIFLPYEVSLCPKLTMGLKSLNHCTYISTFRCNKQKLKKCLKANILIVLKFGEWHHTFFCRFKSWKQFPKLKRSTWLFPINIISVWICPNFPNLSAALIEMTKFFCLLTSHLDILLLPWEEKIWELNCRHEVFVVVGIKLLSICK